MPNCAACDRTALAPHFPKLRIAAVASTVVTVVALAILLSPLVLAGTIAFSATAAVVGLLTVVSIALLVLALRARPVTGDEVPTTGKAEPATVDSEDEEQTLSVGERRQVLADLANEPGNSENFKKFVITLGQISLSAEQNKTVSILNKSSDEQWAEIISDLNKLKADAAFEHTKDYLETQEFTKAFSNVLGEVQQALTQ